MTQPPAPSVREAIERAKCAVGLTPREEHPTHYKLIGFGHDEIKTLIQAAAERDALKEENERLQKLVSPYAPSKDSRIGAPTYKQMYEMEREMSEQQRGWLKKHSEEREATGVAVTEFFTIWDSDTATEAQVDEAFKKLREVVKS